MHPFVGVRAWWAISENWSLVSRADFGYLDSNNQALNLSMLADYRFRDWGSAFLGYRYMNIDYSKGNGADAYAYDADQHGSLAGVTLYW